MTDITNDTDITNEPNITNEPDISVKNENKNNSVEDLLSCAICYDVFIDPVTLMCQHSFCKKCLDNSNTNACPICKLRMFIPPQHNITLDKLTQMLLLEKYNIKKKTINDDELEKNLEKKIKEQIWREVIDSITRNQITIHNGPIVQTSERSFFSNVVHDIKYNINNRPFESIYYILVCCLMVILIVTYSHKFMQNLFEHESNIA